MKTIPYLILLLVLISVSANLYLLFNPEDQKKYIDVANIITGLCLWLIVILLVISKRKLKRKQAKFIHKIYSKN